MAIDPALQRLAPHTVTISPFSSYNSYGESSFGAGVSYQCLIEKKPRMVKDAQGKEVVSSAAVYLTSAPGITVKDKVTLPDLSSPQILSFGTYPNQSGDYFTVVYL